MAAARSTSLRVGFVGLGIMGRPMAHNVLKAGFPLTVFNRTKAKMADLVEAGAQPAQSLPELAEQADVVITIVTDSEDVRQVVAGPEGILAGAGPGMHLIDMSTIAPQTARDLAEAAGQQGVAMLDAPVSGGDVGARNGTLSIMVGGDAEGVAHCRPVLEAMGRNIVHVGPAGAGQAVKLCNQVLVGLHLVAMAEGLSLAAKSGVDPRKMLEVVQAGAAGSWALDNLAPRILDGDFAPGFMVRLQQKDLRLALEAAGLVDLPLPGTSLVQQLLRSVQAYGGNDDGTQAIIRAMEVLGNFRLQEES